LCVPLALLFHVCPVQRLNHLCYGAANWTSSERPHKTHPLRMNLNVKWRFAHTNSVYCNGILHVLYTLNPPLWCHKGSTMTRHPWSDIRSGTGREEVHEEWKGETVTDAALHEVYER
jgi:hypothetical protein